MTNYKKKYNRLKVEYDMLRRASGKKKSKPSGRASELFKTLQSQYIDKLDRLADQQHILSKQTNLLNEKDREIENNSDRLSSNVTKIETNKRKTMYDETDDRNNKTYISSLKAILYLLVIFLIIIIGGMIKEKIF
tara:strand:- start:461 stop:865 length:405 start_codon:yes stop_codon:yes gene_type:complete